MGRSFPCFRTDHSLALLGDGTTTGMNRAMKPAGGKQIIAQGCTAIYLTSSIRWLSHLGLPAIRSRASSIANLPERASPWCE